MWGRASRCRRPGQRGTVAGVQAAADDGALPAVAAGASGLIQLPHTQPLHPLAPGLAAGLRRLRQRTGGHCAAVREWPRHPARVCAISGRLRFLTQGARGLLPSILPKIPICRPANLSSKIRRVKSVESLGKRRGSGQHFSEGDLLLIWRESENAFAYGK